jgi:integrase/recombinase XerC
MVNRFIEYLRYEQNRSELTVARYERSLRDFESYFKGIDASMAWTTIDADVVRNWLETLVDKGHKATSVNADLSALRSFYRFALSRKLVERDPVHGLTGPKKQKPLPQFMRENEMDKLLDQEEWSDTYKDVRARTIILLLYETGIRRSELTGLNDHDIDFEARQLKVTGKRDKQRIVPFGEELATELQRYIEVRDQEMEKKSTALFLNKHGERMTGCQVYSIVREELSKVTTMKKRSPHVLRHTFATAMLNHEAGLESVRLLLGHESLETTEIYTHTTFEQLKRVYKDAHPRG